MGIEPEEREVSLLDVLVVVAENLKLLILGPIAIGLLALAIASLLPKTYTSQAILVVPTPPQAAAMMVSPTVLYPVIESLKLAGRRSMQVAHMDLTRQIKASVGKEALLRLEVTADSPSEAQAIANAVIDNWLKSTVPGPQEREDLEKRLEYAKVSLEAIRRLQSALMAEGATTLGKSLTRSEAGTSIVAVGELQARYLADVLTIPRTLQGLSRDLVKQSPTLPTEPVETKKSLVAAMAGVAGGFVLLLWVLVRHAWKTAALDPAAAEKQGRLVAAIGFKRRPE